MKLQKRSLKDRMLRGWTAACILALPALSQACPQCVNSSPYGKGLIYAVAFIMPIPFALIGFLVWWIARHSPSGSGDRNSADPD
jgi:hypothetical protein